MGIGNTSTASVLMSIITQIPLDQCVGKGTGVSDKKVN
jgi:nicotinate-nucleotide--dimethylbenzimidazole phosphoribosyltransferase